VTGLAIGAALLALAGTTTGASAAVGAQQTDTVLSYTCQFPSGPVHVGVDLAATVPGSGTASGPIQPTAVTAAVTIPGALPDLTQVDAASASLDAQFTMSVTQGGTSSSVAWPNLDAPSTPIPADGDVALAATGPVPAIPVGSTGDLTLAAGPLTLVLTTLTADGSATSPAFIPLICTLDPDQNAVVATVSLPSVPVTGTSGTTSTVPTTSGGPASSGTPAPVTGKPGVGTVGGVHPNVTPPIHALVRGYSDVLKLHGAAPMGLGTGPDDIGQMDLTLIKLVIVDGVSHLQYSGVLTMPPSRATFLAFGFMPNTSIMEFDQVGTFLVDAFSGTAIITGQETIRIRKADVNGVPLAIGDNCMTSAPIDLRLTGEPGKLAYNPVGGGYVDGTATIPPFTNCGTNENLDPLFTGLVSGPGNFMRMEQSKTCPVPPKTCTNTFPD
jgi:hypothetical protein